MCRVIYSDDSEIGLCGQLCWLPAQQPSLSLAPCGIPILFRYQLLHRATSLGASSPYCSSRARPNWCNGNWFSLAFIGSSTECDLVSAEETEVLLEVLGEKKCINSTESHWKEMVSLVPVDVMSRCHKWYCYSSPATCLRMKEMPRMVDQRDWKSLDPC